MYYLYHVVLHQYVDIICICRYYKLANISHNCINEILNSGFCILWNKLFLLHAMLITNSYVAFHIKSTDIAIPLQFFQNCYVVFLAFYVSKKYTFLNILM